MARWRVDIRGKELQNLGTIDASNAWEALAKPLSYLISARPFVARPSSPSLMNRSHPLAASTRGFFFVGDRGLV
jgi:hypothetical protein